MKEGEKVLLPTARYKLLMQWRGPYKIIQNVGSVDFKIDMEEKIRIFHANMLKRYDYKSDSDDFNRDIVGVAVIDEDKDIAMD